MKLWQGFVLVMVMTWFLVFVPIYRAPTPEAHGTWEETAWAIDATDFAYPGPETATAVPGEAYPVATWTVTPTPTRTPDYAFLPVIYKRHAP